MRVLAPAGGKISFGSLSGALKDSLLAPGNGCGAGQSLRRQLTTRVGLKHWVLINSGRSALSITLMALRARFPGRDEVIIPAYTSYSVPAAVVRAGLQVRLCDVEMDSLGLSPKELESVLTSRTLCVVPNHLYAISCQIKAVCEIARHHQVPVVEDAAQALGVWCTGKPVGAFGEVTIFSLSRGKTLPAAGGGLIGTNDESLAGECQRILKEAEPGSSRARRFGVRPVIETALMTLFIRPSLYWLADSLPFLKLGASIYNPVFPIAPMARFQEALAARLLPGLKKLRAIREANAVRLGQAMAELKGLWVIWPRAGDTGGFLRLPVLLRDPAVRDRVLVALQQQGLGVSGGYPLPLSEMPELKPHLAGPAPEAPVAKRISQQLVTLPTHPWVRERDIQRIIEVFRECSR